MPLPDDEQKHLAAMIQAAINRAKDEQGLAHTEPTAALAPPDEQKKRFIRDRNRPRKAPAPSKFSGLLSDEADLKRLNKENTVQARPEQPVGTKGQEFPEMAGATRVDSMFNVEQKKNVSSGEVKRLVRLLPPRVQP
jgi:hypothetical protein